MWQLNVISPYETYINRGPKQCHIGLSEKTSISCRCNHPCPQEHILLLCILWVLNQHMSLAKASFLRLLHTIWSPYIHFSHLLIMKA